MPEGIVFGLSQLNFEHMLRLVTLFAQPHGQSGRELVVHEEAHSQAAMTTG